MDPQLAQIIREKINKFYPAPEILTRALLVDSDLNLTEFSAKDRLDELKPLSDAKEWTFEELPGVVEKDGKFLRVIGGFLEMHKGVPTGNVFILN